MIWLGIFSLGLGLGCVIGLFWSVWGLRHEFKQLRIERAQIKTKLERARNREY